MSEIIAIGGAAFSGEPRNLALDKYVVDQTGKDRPKVLLIPTARGDESRYVMKFYAACEVLRASPSHLSFFDRTPDLRDLVLSQDVVFVGGGNTKSMLGIWREWGLPQILKEASESGIVLGGVSAGAICWFEQGLTDSWAGVLRPIDCMGWLSGSCCPHYDGEADRRSAYHSLLLEGRIKPGYAVQDGVAAHFKDGKLERVVTKIPGSTAYYVSAIAGEISEQPFEATLLAPVL